MANEPKKENVMVIPDQKQAKLEVRDMTESQRARVVALQGQVQNVTLIRNQYMEGVADGMGLDNEWLFDWDGFMAGRNCRFIKPMKEQK